MYLFLKIPFPGYQVWETGTTRWDWPPTSLPCPSGGSVWGKSGTGLLNNNVILDLILTTFAMKFMGFDGMQWYFKILSIIELFKLMYLSWNSMDPILNSIFNVFMCLWRMRQNQLHISKPRSLGDAVSVSTHSEKVIDNSLFISFISWNVATIYLCLSWTFVWTRR